MTNSFFFEREGFSYKKFLSLFVAIYDCFYNDWSDNEAEYIALVEQGDKMLNTKALRPFLKALMTERQDLFTSDRECAALAATYNIFAA